MTDDNIRQIWSDAELDAALTELHSDVGDDGGLAFARSSLLAAAGAEPEEAPKPRRSGSWRWIAVAAAVVTLAGGLAVTADLLSPGAPEPVHPAATPPDLDRPLAPGEYRYQREQFWVPFTGSQGDLAYVEQRVEIWVPADPAGRWHRRSSVTGTVVGHVADADRTKLVAPDASAVDEYGDGGRFPSRLPGGLPGRWPGPDAAFLESLPSDAATLRQLVAEAGRNPSERLRNVATALTPGLPAKNVRAGLVAALGKLDGVTRLPGTTPAPDGRAALVFVTQETRDTLYVDPAMFVVIAISPDPPPVIQYPAGGPTRTSVPAAPTTTIPPPVPTSGEVPVTTSRYNRPPPPDETPAQPPTMFSFSITRGSS